MGMGHNYAPQICPDMKLTMTCAKLTPRTHEQNSCLVCDDQPRAYPYRTWAHDCLADVSEKRHEWRNGGKEP